MLLTVSKADLFEKIRKRVVRSLDLEFKSDRVKGEKYCKFHKDHSRLADHYRGFWPNLSEPWDGYQVHLMLRE